MYRVGRKLLFLHTEREICNQVTMTVDGQQPERWRTLGHFSYLSSSAAFLGGSDGRENIPLLRSINNLVGCIKQVSTLELATNLYSGYTGVI